MIRTVMWAVHMTPFQVAFTPLLHQTSPHPSRPPSILMTSHHTGGGPNGTPLRRNCFCKQGASASMQQCVSLICVCLIQDTDAF